MKKLCLLFGLLIIFLFSFQSSLTAYAQDGKDYRVGATSLNVRSEPDMDATYIGSLETDSVVTVYEERYGWARIDYNGQTGWVASHFLYQSNQSKKASNNSDERLRGKEISVAVDGVYIRTGPGTNHSIIDQAYQGESFQQIEQKNDWVLVQLENGETGWIAGWLIAQSSKGRGKTNPQPQTSSNSSNHSLKGYNIVVDAGHGGFDPGAIGIDYSFEKTLALKTAHTVAKQLRNAGATVIMTRSGDQFLALEERINISQSYDTHAFISLHYNAYPLSGVNGVSTYYYAGGADRSLADEIQQQLVGKTQMQDDGVQYGDFHVLRENSDLAVLVELGFLTNPHDYSVIQTNNYQLNVAQAITQGVMNHFND
ncbi:N-acetylmuramoyl-L-alanine amidase [Pseudalkalibacillus decolorationis]|uniref:N-acetylmuramoyl-L-alanine amidase n=1 Tax=Pseudalkalibacillus decolorationis TaxID=163879 RepID=UPI0021480222|nr:N-acetylmuramoyl-L-alanine amidase [Pseudalkalibacillus decolorationis]